MIRFSAAAWSAILAQTTAAGRAQALATLNPTTIEFLDAADAVIRTVTTGNWTVSGANAVPGTYTDAGTGGGTPATAVFKASGTEVMRMSCGTLAGSDYLLLSNIFASVKIRRGSFAITFLDPPGAGASEPAATVAPVISGTAQVGQTLTATAGTWTGNPVPTITRQWYRGASAISGATGLFYTLVSADAGAIISLVETGTNTVGSVTSTSNTLGPVADGALDASSVPSPINLDIGGAFDFTPYISGGVPPYTVAVASGSSLPANVTLTSNVLSASGSATVALSGDIVFDVDDSAVAATLPTFGVLSSVGGADLPFAFGHVFKQGDVPSGSYVDSDLTDWQVEPRNYWGDGSLAFAVISGRATCAQNVRKDTQLSVSPTPRSGLSVAVVTAADVGTTTATIGANTVSLADAINGADLSAFSGTAGVRPASAGKLRTISGPVMTEEHFYAPFPSLPHACVFWYVRKYLGGRVWIETSIENGWSRITGAVEINATQTIVVNSSTVFSGTVPHRYRGRHSVQAWIGGDPGVTPVHDTEYMRASLMVPNYGPETPSEATLNALVQSVGPMERGPFHLNAAGGGYHEHIGLLAKWDALYITSNADARAYRAVLAAEQASQWCNLSPSSAGLAWRDESTLKPPSIPSFYSDSLSNLIGPGKVVPATNSTAAPWNTDQAHGWAAGYLAYLITGRWFSLETAQMHIAAEHLAWGASDASAVNVHRWMRNEDRAAAWGFRSLMCALSITPETVADQAAYRAALIGHIEAGIAAWSNGVGGRLPEIGQNNLGVRHYGYNATSYAPSPYLSCGAFQEYFVAQAFAFSYQIGGHYLGSQGQTDLQAAAAFHAKWPVGLAGTRPDGFCYKQAANYGLAIGANHTANPYQCYSTFDEVFEANVALGFLSADETCASGGALTGGNFPDATSYWGNFLPALAYAVEMGATGAQDAWDRVTGSSNWSTLYSGFANDAPQFGIVPRAA